MATEDGEYVEVIVVDGVGGQLIPINGGRRIDVVSSGSRGLREVCLGLGNHLCWAIGSVDSDGLPQRMSHRVGRGRRIVWRFVGRGWINHEGRCGSAK